MRFIVFEGPDGSGKSTQSKLLANYLAEQGIPYFLTNEPTYTGPIGKKIRQKLFEEELSPEEETNLFVEDRLWHLEHEIEPALAQGKIVVCDRYRLSTCAYQSRKGLSLNYLFEIQKECKTPDLTIYINISPQVGLARVNNRGKGDYFERIDIQEQIVKTYQEAIKREPNVVIVNGDQEEKKVHQDIIEHFQQLYSTR